MTSLCLGSRDETTYYKVVTAKNGHVLAYKSDQPIPMSPKEKRKIALTDVGNTYQVSTVCLGFSMGKAADNIRPLTYETLVFRKLPDNTTERIELPGAQALYASYIQAVQGHNDMVNKILTWDFNLQ